MHLMDIMAILGITAAVGVLIALKFFKKYKFVGDDIDASAKYTIPYLVVGIRDTFDVILNTDYTELNLNKEETEKNCKSKETLRQAIKTAPHGNTGAKMYVIDYICDLLQRKFGLTDETINYAIPFDNVSDLTAEHKFMILMHIYKKKFDMEALENLFDRNNLVKPIGEGTKEHYDITAADIDLVFRRHMKVYSLLTLSDKIAIVAQMVYQHYIGLGVVDEIRYQHINGFNCGTSGVPQTFYTYGVDTTYGAKAGELPKTACNSVWLMFNGKKVHLSFLGFLTDSELERATKNICRYNNAPTLSRTKGFIINTTLDGCRVVGVRPDMAESFGFFLRKFDASARRSLADLYPFECVDKLQELLDKLIAGCMNTGLTGQQATGKTTCLMTLVGSIPAAMSLRLQETAFELYLRKVYPERNIMTFVETPNVSAQAGVELQKKSDGDVNLFGEVAQAAVVPLALKMGQTGSAMLMFTSHHKTTDDLVNEWGDDLVAEGASTDSFKATQTVASVLDIDIHLERYTDGTRAIARVTQIMPHIAEPYPEFDENASERATYELMKEYFYRRTDRRMFDTSDIIIYYKGRYLFVNDIHPDKVAQIKTHFSDAQNAEFDNFLERVHKEVVANRKLGFTGYSSMDSAHHLYFGTCVDENDNVIGHRNGNVIKYTNGKTIEVEEVEAKVGNLAAAEYAFDFLEGMM